MAGTLCTRAGRHLSTVGAPTVTASKNVAVVGGGFVGISCALHLQRLGHSVTLVDRSEAGSPAQASYGNAGTFAKYASIPVNKPGIFFEVPKMLTDPDGPLALKLTPHLATMAPWGISFLAASREQRVKQISKSLSALLAHSESGWMPAWEQAGVDIEQHRIQNGCLYLYGSQRSLEESRDDTELRRQTCDVQEVTAEEVAKLEPNVSQNYAGGLLFDAWHMRNPGLLAAQLAEGFKSKGGEILKANVTAIVPGSGVLLATGDLLPADASIVCAGAYSKTLVESVGDRIPLDTERGYHITYSGQHGLISRPVGWADSGFYMTPMSHGLRVAGTVELGGLHAPLSENRCEMLERTSRSLLLKLPPRDVGGDWLGFRPTMPDSLPVIGRSPSAPDVIYAFGHQHIGLTLGGVTGALVADLVEGREPSVDLRAYRPNRFSEFIAGEASPPAIAHARARVP